MISGYIRLQWQLPRHGAWIDIAKNKIQMSVGQTRTVTAIAPCDGPTLGGYRSRATDLPQRRPTRQRGIQPRNPPLRGLRPFSFVR